MKIEGRMEEKLGVLFKKYVKYFVKEYSDYLNKDQLEIIKNIDYNKVIKLTDNHLPVGIIDYSTIYVSRNLVHGNNSLVNTEWINNKNYMSYLKYINQLNYDTYHYYQDQLMFLLFKLVIDNDSGLINGFINYEVNNLRRKYNFQAVNLYKREEVISIKVVKLFGRDICRKIMFMDMPTAFKYLNDNLGYRYAEFYYQLTKLVDDVFDKVNKKSYDEPGGLLKYANDYDHLLYGDVYNYLLDFSINNSLSI